MVSGYLDRATGRACRWSVAHSHGHQDHRAGDAAFAALPATTVAPVESEALRQFLGLQDWPNGGAQIDLGDRIDRGDPDARASRGSRRFQRFAHAAGYSPGISCCRAGCWSTTSTLIAASARRVAEFVKTYAAEHALGAHIELDAAGEALPSGATLSSQTSARCRCLAPRRMPWRCRRRSQDFNGFYSPPPELRGGEPGAQPHRARAWESWSRWCCWCG